ncbi:MAG: prephenate dehydratase [Pseudomonadales bacterium]|nr:prephenate dehydratase [Pseudomonadales bacterium]
MDKTKQLLSLRTEIDDVDLQIHALLNKRASLAISVAEAKKQGNENSEIVYYRPEREAQVLRKVMERNEGPLDGEVVARLFREIMSSCLAVEQRMKIAYLGPEGTFTQTAALKHFGHSVEVVAFNTIDEVFREVEAGSANYGVVPVENSSEGMVNHTLDSFMNSPLRICGEVALRIHQHFLMSENGKPENITRVYSHQQSLAQCRKWLDSHWPSVERISVSSNAEAAKRTKGEWHSAAIAGDTAAELYGLTKFAENIEDSPDNTTRFLIIGQEEVPASDEDKTSVIVSTRNRPGALYRLLAPFQELDISLTRIETRPDKTGTWAYVFFIDFEGHESEENIQKVMEKIAEESVQLKLLGSYPKAVL